ncbi:unnamed protein product [Phytophthora fragariaefolia]|uniref:Unnamed protein product n=1 Tax=Phytophthora fragariaefolia TaxID=1490495 RepID=A0A9W7CHB5_9STRA|nr:unnamed protein product [Phytophthora fragariaefolia]
MVAVSSANAASGAPSGGSSAASSVRLAPPARNDGRSSSDESEEEEVEWQLPGSKEVSPNPRPRIMRPRLRPSRRGPSDNPPPDTEVGKTTGPQAISVDRTNALQTLGVLPFRQGSSSGMPVVVEIPPGEPSDLTVPVVGVPMTESHSDGRTFLQDGFGGLEALVQMESLGATEFAVLNDFFDDNDIIGDFILTPRETPLTATELSSQLKNFAVKRKLASILPVRLQATGPPDVWDGVASPEGGCQVRSDQAQAGGSRWRRVSDLASRQSPAAQARPAVPVQLLDREGGGSPEGEKRCRGADAFGLCPAHGGA